MEITLNSLTQIFFLTMGVHSDREDLF